MECRCSVACRPACVRVRSERRKWHDPVGRRPDGPAGSRGWSRSAELGRPRWRIRVVTLVRSRGSRVVLRATALLVAAIHPLALVAQDPDPLSRLDPNTRFVVEVIIDSARVAGVPTRPLLLKALQGAAYHADNRHIIAAVRSVFHAELDVRVALGSALNESEWASAVSALQSGVPL